MLQALDIGKSYTNRGGTVEVLKHVSLALSPGDSVAIMGPSGSGKSTLLNILGTLDIPSNGQVLLDGVDPFRLPAVELSQFRNRSIGFVFQNHHLLPQCTLLENVLLPSLAGTRGNAPVDRARGLLDQVGLADRLSHRPAELSGGEQQRAAIARALLLRPKLVLADEPTGNLDQASAETVADLLGELPKSEGAILIVVTHSERIASRTARRFVLTGGMLEAR